MSCTYIHCNTLQHTVTHCRFFDTCVSAHVHCAHMYETICHVHVYTTHACVFTCVCVCVCMCMWVCVYVCVCVQVLKGFTDIGACLGHTVPFTLVVRIKTDL